jgi:hypothetical protein
VLAQVAVQFKASLVPAGSQTWLTSAQHFGS